MTEHNFDGWFRSTLWGGELRVLEFAAAPAAEDALPLVVAAAAAAWRVEPGVEGKTPKDTLSTGQQIYSSP